MVKFEDLNITQLRKIVRAYRLHYSIPRFTKLTRDELITEMKKHLKIENDIIKSIQSNFSQEVPKKPVRQPRQRKARTPRKRAQPAQPAQPAPVKKVAKVVQLNSDYETESDSEDSDDELYIESFSDKEIKELSNKSSLTDDEIDEENVIYGGLKDSQKIKLREIERKYKIEFYQYSKIHNNGETYTPCIFFFRDVDFNVEGKKKKINSVKAYRSLVDKIRTMVDKSDLVGFKKMELYNDYFDYINTKEVSNKEVNKLFMITILFHQKIFTSELVKLSSPTDLVEFKTPDIDELNNIGEYLLNQMGNDNQKIFICHNELVDNELNNKLTSLGKLLKYNNLSQIWGRGTFNIANFVGECDLDMYNITKEQGKIVLRSICCMNIRKNKELYIEFLSGSKYTFRIFEYINNIINNKKGVDEYNSIDWKGIKY